MDIMTKSAFCIFFIIFSLMAAGCLNETDTSAPVDKTDLAAKIIEAAAAKDSAVISADGSDILSTQQWVTQAVVDALDTAITKADGVNLKANTTQAEINSTVKELTNALAKFNEAKKTGTNTGVVNGVDKTVLAAKIAEAVNTKIGVTESIDGSDVLITEQWVTQAVADALEMAITTANGVNTAENTTQSEVDSAAAALGIAIETFISAKQAGTNTGVPIPELHFGILSDVHIGYTGRGAGAYSLNTRLAKALEWYQTQTGVNTVIINGDLTQNAQAAEFDSYQTTINDNRGRLRIITAMGNHDAYLPAGADSFESVTGRKTNAHYKMNGYHLIVVSAGSGAMTSQGAVGGAIATARSAVSGNKNSNADAHDTNVKNWLRDRINAAKADAPGLPVFVFNHWPIENTFYVSNEWRTYSFGNDPLNGWFKDDKEVVIFGGHIHSPNNDPRSIWQGGFTSVNVPSTNYIEMEKGYLGDSPDGVTTKTYPKIAAQASGQGLIVKARGSQVTIENYDFDFCEGEKSISAVVQIPQTWTFDVTKPQDFPYTQAKRETQKTAPVFDASKPASGAITDMITIKDSANTTVEVEFTQAKMPQTNPGNEVVHSYRFEFRKTATGAVGPAYKQWSDFMLTPRLQKETYTQLLGGLAQGTEYELRIYAIGSFQKESSQYLTKTFTTTGVAVAPVAYALKFQDNLTNTSTNPATVTVTGTAAYQAGAKTGQKAIKLNGDNYIQLDTADAPFDYNQSFTVAFWVKVLSTKGVDPVIFSNKNWASGGNNGFLFMVKGYGTGQAGKDNPVKGIRLNTKSVSDGARLGGAEDITITTGADIMNTWVHIAVVYDKAAGANGQVRYYANGVKTGESNTNLSNGISGELRSYLGNSNNGGSNLYNGASKSYNAEFLMQDFLLQEGTLSDSDIAALAAAN